jgi:O-antigen/teichoic acid export membrane protein
MTIKRNTIKRNLIANYLGQGWVALMSLAFIPLYIKYLGIEAYGLIGMFALLQSWLGLLDMGMTPTLGREMARFVGGSHSNESIRDLLRSIEVVVVGIALLMTSGVALSSNWIATSWLKADKLSGDIVTQAIVLMGLVIALRFAEGIYRSALVGLQRQVLFSAVNSLMATLRGLGAVTILIWVSPTISAFFLWQGTISLATLAILGISTYASLPRGEREGKFSVDALRQVWRFAGGMAGITLSVLLLTQVDKILLSKLLSLVEFGYYTLAGTVAGTLYLLLVPITQTFYPKFCELHARSSISALSASYHKASQLVSVVAGSVAIVLFFFAQNLLYLWTQDVKLAQNVAPLVSLLVLGNLLNGLMYIPYQLQLAYGWTSLAVRINTISILVIVPIIFWAVPRYGVLSAAWTWIGLNLGYLSIGIHFMHRRIMSQEKWSWLIRDVFIPLVISLFTVFGIYFAWSTPVGWVWQIFRISISLLLAIFFSALASSLVKKEFLKAID